MKYILMMNGTKKGWETFTTWPKEDIQAHINFMKTYTESLAKAGELVGADGLAMPDQAVVVRAGKDGAPVTDGVFPESKEFLAGWWIIDVDSPERAYQIAAGASAAPGLGGAPMNMPIEVRQVMSGPPEEFCVSPTLSDAHAELLRDLTPQVLGALMRRFRDFSDAEDAVQEALLAAARQWPVESLPSNPRAWLIQVASRRLTDHIRSQTARRQRETAAAPPEFVNPAAWLEYQPTGDDTLVLVFMCCHPALSPSSAIALTLRAVGGLTTAEIAKAFLVPEPTMAQRISRAKQTIKSSGVPFRLPTVEERPQHLAAVLHVLYLIFNLGYTTSSGPQLQRTELSTEAIRLTRAVYRLLPAETEVAGLLALLLLTDARRSARTGPLGEIIPLAQQDRTLWDQTQIAEGVALISATLPKGEIGSYQLQAAIAAVHDEARRYEDTDWPQILALYDILRQTTANPMIMLNHAVAAAMVHGPAHGLELLSALDADDRLKCHHRLDAVRAHLLEMNGDFSAAITHYLSAASRTHSLPEREYLINQAARLRDQSIA